jgi:hypothetical protein
VFVSNVCSYLLFLWYSVQILIIYSFSLTSSKATLHTSFIWNVLWSRSMLRSPTILHHRFCNSHPNYNSPPCEGDSRRCYICSCHCLTTAHHISTSRRIRRIVNKSLVQATIRAPQLANRLIGDALTSFLSRCHPS